MSQTLPTVAEARKIKTPQECASFIHRVLDDTHTAFAQKQTLAYQALYATGRTFITAALKYDEGFEEIAGAYMNHDSYLAVGSEQAIRKFTNEDAIRTHIDTLVGTSAVRYYGLTSDTSPLAASVILGKIREFAHTSGRFQDAAEKLLCDPDSMKDFLRDGENPAQPRAPKHTKGRRKPLALLPYDVLKENINEALIAAKLDPYFDIQAAPSLTR